MKMFAPLALAGLLVLPSDAQKRQTNRRTPIDVSIAGGGGGTSTTPYQAGLFCVQRIADQANGGCLEASSTPTFGVLFPYPGTNNVFDPSIGAFVGGGENNQAGSWSTVGGGHNNTAADYAATVGGGRYNTASYFHATVGGGRYNTASGESAVVGGGGYNTASGGYATVGGGGGNDASGDVATVGGGGSNTASGQVAAVGGGQENTASGLLAMVGGGIRNTASDTVATVGGGAYNIASEESAVVGGGSYNTASGSYATVGGGGGRGIFGYPGGNTASGDRSTVPGGADNVAQGTYSFAAGREAMANHAGSFVWGDSQGGVATKASSSADEFNVYASGGARFFSNSAATTGVLLAPGGGSWTAVSSREMKENVKPVNVQAVLEAVVAVPITTWNYKEQSDEIRHMGPMAQDFYAAFGLGLGETTIDTIDPDGVALAAIQGMNAKLEQRLTEKDAEIAELRERLERLEAKDAR